MQIDCEQRLARQDGGRDRRRDRELSGVGREEAAANARRGLSQTNQVGADRTRYPGRAGQGSRCESDQLGWEIRVSFAAAEFNAFTKNVAAVRSDRSVRAQPLCRAFL